MIKFRCKRQLPKVKPRDKSGEHAVISAINRRTWIRRQAHLGIPYYNTLQGERIGIRSISWHIVGQDNDGGDKKVATSS